VIEDWNDCFTISAIYSSFEHIIKREENFIKNFFENQGKRFIAARDYDVKYTHWESRLIISKGRGFLKMIEAMNLAILSIEESIKLEI